MQSFQKLMFCLRVLRVFYLHFFSSHVQLEPKGHFQSACLKNANASNLLSVHVKSISKGHSLIRAHLLVCKCVLGGGGGGNTQLVV